MRKYDVHSVESSGETFDCGEGPTAGSPECRRDAVQVELAGGTRLATGRDNSSPVTREPFSGLVDRRTERPPKPPEDLPVSFENEVDGLRCLVVVEATGRLKGTLSPREEEIARMVGLGYPNKTIAANLGISSWTVSTHLRRMFAKFGVRSRAALVAAVLEERRVFDERRGLRSGRAH